MNYYLSKSLGVKRDMSPCSLVGVMVWQTCRAYTLLCLFLLLAMANAAYAQPISATCNTPVTLTNATVTVNPSLGGSISNQGAITSALPIDDFATLNGGLAGNVVVRVKHNGGQYPGGVFAGFDIASPGFITNQVRGIIVTTFLNGQRQESTGSLNLGVAVSMDVALVATKVTGNDGRQRVGFMTKDPFDEIQIYYARNEEAKLYGATVERRCSILPVACQDQVNVSFPEVAMRQYVYQVGGCLSPMTNLDALSSPDTTDFIQIIDGANVGCARTVGVQLGEVLPAGMTAGIEISQQGIISIEVADASSIATYKNGVFQERRLAVDVLDPQWIVDKRRVFGFKTTKDFDEIRYTYGGSVSVGLSSTNLYRFIVENPCPGPELACNEIRYLTRPNHAVKANSFSSPYLGVVGCSATIVNLDAVISKDLNDWTAMSMFQANQCVRMVTVVDEGTTYPAGTYAGVDMNVANLVSFNSLNTRTVMTLLNGKFVDQRTQGSLLQVDLMTSTRSTFGFPSSGAFNEIRYIEYAFFTPATQQNTLIYGMVVKKICPGPIPACTTPNRAEEKWAPIIPPLYPITISGDPNKSALGVSVCSNTLRDVKNLTDNDPNSSAKVTMTGFLCLLGINFELNQEFPAGVEVGVDIEEANLASVQILSGITITTSLRGIPQEVLGIPQVQLFPLQAGNLRKRGVLGAIAKKPFDRVVYTQSNIAEFSFGETYIYGLVMKPPVPVGNCPAPTVAIVSPANNSTIATQQPPVSGTATRLSSVTVTSNTGSANLNKTVVVSADASGLWSTNEFYFNNVGSQTITAVASNAVGTSIPAINRFTVNTGGGGGIPAGPPEVRILTPIIGTMINASRAPISGIGTPGAVVTVNRTPALTGGTYVNQTVVTVGANGNWSTNAINYDPASYGSTTITAVAVNSNGSSPTSVVSFSVGPPEVKILYPVNGSVILDQNPRVNGTGEPGATVTLARTPFLDNTDNYDYINNETVTVSPDGTWSSAINFDNQFGSFTVTAQMPVPGGVSNAATEFSIDYAAPVIISPVQNGSYRNQDLGNGNADNFNVSGTAGPGSTVRIKRTPVPGGSEEYAAGDYVNQLTVTADGQGNWTDGGAINLGDLEGGPYTITVELLGAFNRILSSATRNFYVSGDRASSTNVAIDSPTTSQTIAQHPTITGRANAGVVVITGGAGSSGGPVTLTVDATQAWSTTALTFTSGPRSITARVTALNGGTAQTTTNFVVGPSPALAITEPVANTTITIAPGTRITVAGTATPNTVVRLSTIGSIPVSVTATGSGAWSTTALTFSPGSQTITASASNIYGEAVAVRSFTAVVSPKPTVEILSPTAGSTVSSRPIISGTATVGSTVYVAPKFGAPLAVSVSQTGTWSTSALQFVSSVGEITVYVSESDGDKSDPVVRNFNVLPFPTVTINAPSTNSPAGLQPVIVGQSTPEAVIRITGGVGSTGGPVSVTADGSGTWSTSALTFAPGARSITAVATNALSESATTTSDFVAVAPLTFAIVSPAANSTVATTSQISGTATAGAVIMVSGGASTTGGSVSVTADGSGNWSTSGLTFTAGAQSITVVATNALSESATVTRDFVAVAGVSSNLLLLSPKVFLAGAYFPFPVTRLMRDDLRRLTLIPFSDPYSTTAFASTFTHTPGSAGLATTAGVLSVTGTNAIVDWVFVELRNPGSGSAVVVATRAGLVQRDGDVVDVDGVSPLSFSVASGSYHVVVRHRNHLRIMSRNSMMLSATATTVDFTNPATPTMGAHGQELLVLPNSTTVAAMWGGDANGNSLVLARGGGSDNQAIIQAVAPIPSRTLFGYSPLDLTMDGVVNRSGPGNDISFLNRSAVSNPLNPSGNPSLGISPGF